MVSEGELDAAADFAQMRFDRLTGAEPGIANDLDRLTDAIVDEITGLIDSEAITTDQRITLVLIDRMIGRLHAIARARADESN